LFIKLFGLYFDLTGSNLFVMDDLDRLGADLFFLFAELLYNLRLGAEIRPFLPDVAYCRRIWGEEDYLNDFLSAFYDADFSKQTESTFETGSLRLPDCSS
jgi:hypothetical protein